MVTDWNEVQKALFPIKDYDDLRRRWQESLGYAVVRAAYNFTMPDLVEYTHRCLGGDTRSRYTAYEALLVRILATLDWSGVKNILDLAERISTPELVPVFL